MRRGPAFAVVAIAAAVVFAHVACSTFDSESTPAPADAGTSDVLADVPADQDTTVVLDPGDDPDATTAADALAIPDGGKIVFVTKEQIRGGQIGSRDNADVLCTNIAHKAGFDGDFAAFLRQAPFGAAAHIPNTGSWYRLDGALAFSTQPSSSTAALAELNVNQEGAVVIAGAKAWTGANGATTNEGSCNTWSDTTAGDAVVGSAFDTATWANAGTRACSEFARLYCFQK